MKSFPTIPAIATWFALGQFLLLAATEPVAATEFGLFADVTFVDDDIEDSPSSFVLGGLDFYVLQQIAEKTTGFVELVVEGDDSEFEAEIERLWVRYDASEVFSIGAGRFHSPLGFWNRHYHHGNLLQDTVFRPFFLDWEHDSGILPVHLVGLMASGETWAGIGTFQYEIVVGNGHSLDSAPPPDDGKRILEPIDFRDLNDDKAVAGRFSLRHDAGWQVGIFGTSQRIAEGGSLENGSLRAQGDDLFEQTILGLDLRFEVGRFGLLAEIFDLDNDALYLPPDSNDATAFYVQAWFDVAARWRLVYRFSSLDHDDGDPYFGLLDVAQQDHNLLTLSYRPNEVNAIKLEADLLSSPVDSIDGSTTLRAQWAFLIP